MRQVMRAGLVAGCLVLAAGRAWGEAAASQPAQGSPASAGSVLYEDAEAKSSATITQILPNSNTSLMTLGAVRRIRIVQDVVIVEWGTTATTLLPRQFVGSINVNKRSGGEAAEGK